MNKKFIFIVLIILISLLYFFNFEKVIASKFSSINNAISSYYIQAFIFTGDVVNKYFNQLNYVEELKKSNNEYLQYKLLYEKKVEEIRELNKTLQILVNPEKVYEKIKVLSYYSIGDYSKVIIDKGYIPKEKIYPLITLDGFSAGIAMNKNNQSIAYLNQNEKCNYTVYIGEENAPGITSGVTENGEIIIRYVPIWKEVEIDDEVITSGMDSIFEFGIKVGKVTSIKVFENTKEILVKPYATTFGVRNFFITVDTPNIVP